LDDLHLDHDQPTVEGVRARLAATSPWSGTATSETDRPRTLAALLNMLERGDRRSAEHAFRVAELAASIGVRLGMAPGEVARLRLASLLHDIGKLAIPDAVLDKPGPLSEAEWRRIHAHPEYGFQMVASAVHPDVAATVRLHCERLDGRGYPNGARGEEIPLAPRVLLVADVFDAMRTDRPYRGALESGEALTVLRRGAGSEYDARVVQTLHLLAYEQGLQVA
jgi:HD-GYP domain-containing protein (c-di-GMP phosphodiesterase class II)